MRFAYFLPVLGLAATPCVVLAQIPAGMPPLAPAPQVLFASAQPHAVIGISTVSGSSNRDTLGVLVSIVRPGSPAEKAGLQEGDRVASVNGTNLRLAHSDVGDEEMAGAMSNRLQRAMSHVKAGDAVQLRVYSAGEWKSVTVKAEMPPEPRDMMMRSREPRATLGVSLASMGNARDSLGVLIMGLTDGGPAARAGLEEGNRIQSINGVDLRRLPGKDEDDADSFGMMGAPARKLQRALDAMKPGDVAKLRVYADGGVRNVDVKTVDAKDLPGDRRSIIIRTPEASRNMTRRAPMPDMESMDVPMPRVELEPGGNVTLNLRRTLDGIRATSGPLLESLGTAVRSVGFGLERRRVDW